MNHGGECRTAPATPLQFRLLAANCGDEPFNGIAALVTLSLFHQLMAVRVYTALPRFCCTQHSTQLLGPWKRYRVDVQSMCTGYTVDGTGPRYRVCAQGIGTWYMYTGHGTGTGYRYMVHTHGAGTEYIYSLHL